MFSNPHIFPTNHVVFLSSLLLSIFCFAQAQPAPGQSSPSSSGNTFQPSLAVVIGIMSAMFFLTFILIVYAKFCQVPHNNPRNIPLAVNNVQNPNGFVQQSSVYRGVDKTVVESLPFFRFSSLKGSRRGLECVVCISKFEDVEILRLLPKCKHAFHIGCIDEWLEKHSDCPLCRAKIDAEDLAMITKTDSMRSLSGRAEAPEEAVELYVQRQDSARSLSSRFNFRNSLRKSSRDVAKQQDRLPIQEDEDGSGKIDKFNHKIIVSDSVLKKRWSYLSSSDLVKLNSDMLGDVSRQRFHSFDKSAQRNASTWASEGSGISEVKESKTDCETEVVELDRNNSVPSSSYADYSNESRILNADDKRSMSEIGGFSRFKRSFSVRKSPVAKNGGEEDGLKSVLLPIVQRTVHWHGDREKKSQESDNMRESLNV